MHHDGTSTAHDEAGSITITFLRSCARIEAVNAFQRIGARNDVILVGPTQDADDAPEDFFACYPHVVAHIGETGWRACIPCVAAIKTRDVRQSRTSVSMDT